MLKNYRYKRISFIMFLLITVMVLLTNCFRSGKKAVIIAPNGEAFAGDITCMRCHENIYQSYVHTAHRNSSAPANEQTIKGSFEEGNNEYMYNPYDRIRMEHRDSGYYQVWYSPLRELAAHRFDIVIGSGTKGQSYLYWNGNELFQLPVSFYTGTNSWANSPGYPNRVFFNRIVNSTCLACHSTYFKPINTPGTPPAFSRKTIIYGITCERCHGPGAQHVAYFTSHPNDSIARYIIQPQLLTRQQQLDACAICHSGMQAGNHTQFSFITGDTLNHSKDQVPAHLDVHGNQYGLLIESKCFLHTQTLTCNTCHNTHQTEKENNTLFNARCMSCHASNQLPACPMYHTMGTSITQYCINCHMPGQPSTTLTLQLKSTDEAVPAMVHTHRIAIYANATQQVMGYLQLLQHGKKLLQWPATY
jgi:hypothetical protein